ncbi:hypothetical protein BD779DRAFT_1207915 [Infundibulicybe gibba]|nr:hypothetical protein BD779DRAFT_1207915 [Infundibulicybe gibba]
MKIATCNILAKLGSDYWVSFARLKSLFNLLDDENNDAGIKIATCDVLAALTHQNHRNPGFKFDNNTWQLNILFNLLDDKHSDVGMKIATCSILAGLARNDYIFGDNVTAPVIYRLIVDSNLKLQIAGLETLGGFRHGSIPLKVLATLNGLVVPMLIDGTEKDRLSATLALCSCIHEPDFFHGITKDLGISKLVDILAGYLEDGTCPGTIVRGLVGLIGYGELPQQVIAQPRAGREPRIAAALVDLFDDDMPRFSRGRAQAGVQGALAFGQSDILRVSLRKTFVLRYLSHIACDSKSPAVQRDALLALEALVKDDIIAKEAMELHGLPQEIRRQLKSDPRMISSNYNRY